MAQLAYTKLGNGAQKVMVLHGWFGDQTMFNGMQHALDLDQFTYVLPSYRGYGESKSMTGQYTMQEIATDVIALADDLGWDTFSLIGHSMGGMAVQRVLADIPNRIDKVIALNPVPTSGTPLDADGEALFGGAAENLQNRYAIIDLTTGHKLTATWIQHMVDYSAHTASKEAFAAYLHAWTKTDFHQEIDGNPVPIKIIVGVNDAAISPELMHATYMQWYPNATLEILQNAGHYPMEETPIALATSIETFLTQTR